MNESPGKSYAYVDGLVLSHFRSHSHLLVDEFPHGLHEQTWHRSGTRLKLQLSAAQFLGSFACGSETKAARSTGHRLRLKGHRKICAINNQTMHILYHIILYHGNGHQKPLLADI